VVKWAIAELAIPVVFKDVLGVELVPEPEDTVRAGFRGIKVVFGTFEGSELLNRKVFRETFDREAGKIVGHSMCFWSVGPALFNSFVSAADCSFFVDW